VLGRSRLFGHKKQEEIGAFGELLNNQNVRKKSKSIPVTGRGGL
jgi:hypothetical protein